MDTSKYLDFAEKLYTRAKSIKSRAYRTILNQAAGKIHDLVGLIGVRDAERADIDAVMPSVPLHLLSRAAKITWVAEQNESLRREVIDLQEIRADLQEIRQKLGAAVESGDKEIMRQRAVNQRVTQEWSVERVQLTTAINDRDEKIRRYQAALENRPYTGQFAVSASSLRSLIEELESQVAKTKDFAERYLG
jgi:chromosome segregation ATPase